MFKELFIQLHQSIEDLDDEFIQVKNIDEELSLLEKYLTIKEMSTDLIEEVNKLNGKISKFEKEHGLSDFTIKEYNNSPILDDSENTLDGEEIVIQLEEEDFITFQSGIGFYDLLMHDRAKINLEEIVNKYPDFNLARLYSSMNYFKQKQFSKAKREIFLLFKMSEDNELLSLGHNILGMIYDYENDYDKAIEHFQQAISLKNNWNESKFNLAIVFLKNKMVVEAIDLLEELFEQDQTDWESLMLLGKAYYLIHQFDLAKEFYRQAYSISKKPAAIKHLVRHFEHLNDHERSIYWYKKWLNNEPKSLTAIIGLTKNLWLIDKQDEAQAMIKKGLTLEPDNIEALMLLAWLQTKYNSSSAMKVLEQVERIRSTSEGFKPIIAANLARLYYLNKDYSTANSFCELLLGSTQTSIRGLGHLVKGFSYLDQHEPSKALAHLEDPAAFSLNFPNMSFYIGYSHYLLGDLEQAKTDWSK